MRLTWSDALGSALTAEALGATWGRKVKGVSLCPGWTSSLRVLSLALLEFFGGRPRGLHTHLFTSDAHLPAPSQ